MPTALFCRAPMQGGQLIAKSSITCVTSSFEIDSFKCNKGVIAIDTDINHLRHANRICCRQFTQALGFGIKHIERRRGTSFYEQVGVGPHF